MLDPPGQPEKRQKMLFLCSHDDFQEPHVRTRIWNQADYAVGKAGQKIENGGISTVCRDRDDDDWRLKEFVHRRTFFVQCLGEGNPCTV